MTQLRLMTLLLLAWGAFHPGAMAQKAYRCGDSYSQTPCPGGTVVDVADERSKTQKAQADAAIQRDSRTAVTLEKGRLQQEERQARAAAASAQQRSPEAATAGAPAKKPAAGNKSKPPAYFTARPAGEKKQKSSAHAPSGTDGKPAAGP